MNLQMMTYILGNMLKAEAALMIPSALVSLYYGEASGVAFWITVAILAVLGFSLAWKKPANPVIYAREGFLIVALTWLLLSLFGSLPFFLSGSIPSFIDAFFETVSGFTTTGASILVDVEALDRGMLFWRSFTHWIGGMGVLVFVMAIIPLAGNRSMHLMRAESPGPSVGKLVPKLQSTASILYSIYIVMTVAEIILLAVGGMPLFDSVVHAFGTAGTGGFGIRAASVGAYGSNYIYWVITIFMILFGINFNFFYFLLIRKFTQAFRMEEVRWYFLIIIAAIAVITVNILPLYSTAFDAFTHASFQVGSIITTTGYATVDFNAWPELSRTILVVLMVIGACAGSTGGGIKISRLIILCKSVTHELRQMRHPRSVELVKMDRTRIDGTTLRGVYNFFIVYAMILVVSVLCISLDGFSFETNVTAALSTLNNIGPGLDVVGPAGNFAAFSPFSKSVLCFNMLAGRLELFPMLFLLTSLFPRRHK